MRVAATIAALERDQLAAILTTGLRLEGFTG
jgi:hypothetical protein